MEQASMTRRWLVLTFVIACITVPSVFVFFAAASSAAGNSGTQTLVSAGLRREYILHVPPTYDPSRPAPLVMSLHGAGNWPAFQMHATRWNQVADEHGFLVVYPGGEGATIKTFHLRGRATPSRMPDVVFISELVDHLSKSYNIDRRAIYANGLSNGGGATFVLSCALSDRIAAFGVVGAAVTMPMDWCTQTRPAPLIAFHGTADRQTPYDGGKVWIAPLPFPSIPEWTARWAARNGCFPTPVDVMIAADVTRREYRACTDDADVVFYRIEGGGHTWPGGPPFPEWLLGKTTQNVDATREMWAFFSRHRLIR
jgi:polyhydroxybutyrate depolymerase